MTTTLAQRLRAARTYAKLRQQDIADACALAGFKVSRSAVAQWEYEDERRTQPGLDHIKIVAKRTGVPLNWLMSDDSNLADIWGFANLKEAAPVAPMPLSAPPADRYTDAACKAIEFAVVSRKPDMAAAFGRQLGHGLLRVQPDFLWGSVLAEFTTAAASADKVGILLTAEQALSRKMRKVVVELTPQGGQPHEIYGIHVVPVTSPDEAAQALIALCD